MKFSLLCGLLGIILVAGCSGGEPEASFLASDMRIITGLNSEKKTGVDTELLRMKPRDLYGVFDNNIRSKKWKKIHENSWEMIVKAGKPNVTYRITLVRMPFIEDSVIIKEMMIDGRKQDSVFIMDMMREIDKGFAVIKR